MRTQQEILTRIKERQPQDPFGFEVSEYIRALSREHIAPFLNETAKPEDWVPAYTTDEEVLAVAKEYVKFAYGKIYNQRGISANRSIQHYVAWLWLVGNDDLCARVQAEYEADYKDYGMHILNKIVLHYGWDRCGPEDWDR